MGRLKLVKLENLKAVKEKFAKYVVDKNDTHIVAGVVRARAKFLISYNLRHYRADVIKGDFGIIIMSPGKFLQYLRSGGRVKSH